VTSPWPDSVDQDLKHHRAILVLAVLNLMATAGTTLFLSIRFGKDLSSHPLAQASLLFTGGLVLIDLAWLGLVLAGLSKGRVSANSPQSFSILKALTRLHSLVAWLIFHSAEIPLLVLGPQSGSLQVPPYLAFLFAVLFMGLLPVGLIIWLDVYLARKLRH